MCLAPGQIALLPLDKPADSERQSSALWWALLTCSSSVFVLVETLFPLIVPSPLEDVRLWGVGLALWPWRALTQVRCKSLRKYGIWWRYIKKALLIIKGSSYTFNQLHSLCHWASSWWLKLTNWWINLVFVVLFVSIPWRQQNKKWICIYHCNSYRLMTWEPLWSNCLISLPYMFPFILEMEICQNHLKFSWTDVDWVKGLAQGHLASGNEGGARAFHRLILSVQRI